MPANPIQLEGDHEFGGVQGAVIRYLVRLDDEYYLGDRGLHEAPWISRHPLSIPTRAVEIPAISPVTLVPIPPSVPLSVPLLVEAVVNVRFV